MSDGRPGPRPAGPGVAPPSLGALSTGVVFVRVSPVRDDAETAELTVVLRRIHGVDSVEVGGTDGASALFRVVLGRPVSLGSDLRAVFGRGLRSFTRVADGFEVVLNAPQPTPAPAPRTSRRAAWPGFPDGTGPDLPFVGPRARRPAAPPAAPGPWGVPTPGTAADGSHVTGAPANGSPPPPRAAGTSDPPRAPRGEVPPDLDLDGGDPAAVADALASERDLSVFVIDPASTVRAVFGGLHARSVRMNGPLVGRTIADIAPPTEYPGLAERIAGALAGTPGSLEAHSASSDRIYRLTVNPITDGPQVKGCVVVVRDVAEQHRDRRLLAEMTDVFEIAFERSPAGQALLSPSGRWLRLNPALERLLGRDADSLLGAGMAAVCHPDDAATEERLRTAAVRRSGDDYGLDLRLARGDHSHVTVHAEVTAIRDEQGDVRGFLAHIIDEEVWAASASRRERPRETRHEAAGER